jgi:hypothetical protein
MRRNSDLSNAAVDAELRERVWKRVSGEEPKPIVVTPAYFIQVSRNFQFETRADSPLFHGALYWAWDVFQGYVVPSVVVARFFPSLEVLQENKQLLERAEGLNAEHVRRLLCVCEEHEVSRVSTKLRPFGRFVYLTATELPAKQHSVATLAPQHANDAEWVRKVLRGVTAATDALRPLGVTAVLSPETIFCRAGKPDRVYVTQLIRNDVPLASGEPHPSDEEKIGTLTQLIQESSSLRFSYTECLSSIDAVGGDHNASGDEDDTPIIFEQVGNCPIILREVCFACGRLVRSAGYHMRGVDCSRAGRHFECQDCLNRRIHEQLESDELTLATLPCVDRSCPGVLDFDDFGALMSTTNLRDWNRRGRENAVKEVEKEVNERLRKIIAGEA